MLRRLLPASIWPLAVLATALTAAVWLRTFPADTAAVPVFGAAVLSVFVSGVAVVMTRRAMWVTVPIAAIAFLVYTLTIVLRDPVGFGELVDGFRRGPARLVSFALPLVSPLSLLVVPVALCWLVGALAAEAIGRSRTSWLPYPIWLVGFGAGYAGTARAYTDGGRSNLAADTALGAGLLATLALLRVAQVWVGRDDASTPAGVESALPLRSLAAGVLVTALAVAVGAVGVQTAALHGRPRAVQREPSVQQSDPTTPLAFVASLRPADRTASGPTLFRVTTDRATLPYVSLASVDFYDGDSWGFERSFRPSGGVIPADIDPTLTGRTEPVTQRYRITGNPLVAAPWMPYLSRPERITGRSVNVDASSAMVVPTEPLSVGSTYEVQSRCSTTTLDQLGSDWLAATSPPPIDSQLPNGLRSALTAVVAALAAEVDVASTQAPQFISALVADLRGNYALTDPAGTSITTGTPSAARTPSPSPSPSLSPTTSPTATRPADDSATSGGTSFAAVLASVLGEQRSGTPEQFATLVALVARAVGVPARVVSGFRLTPADRTLPAGDHDVTAAMAYTWVEIPVRDAGWVVLDPSPSRYADSAVQNTVGVQSSSAQASSAPPTNNALVTQASGGQAIAPRSRVDTGSPGSSTWWWAIPAGIAGLALLGGASVLALKVTRRRRRRTGDPRRQVIGAWHESLDLLDEAGLAGLSTLTGAEVTTASGERFGVESAGAVAVISTTANRALFDDRTVIEPSDVDAAWRAHDNLRRALRDALPLRARVVTALRYRRRH